MGTTTTLASIDTATLPIPAAKRLQEQLERVSRQAANRAPSAGADQFRYQVLIEEPAGASRTLEVVDEAIVDDRAMLELQALVRLIEASAAPAGG